MRNVTLDDVLACNGGVHQADISDEKGLLNIETGRYYVIDKIGSQLWAYAETGMDIRSIVAVITEHYQSETHGELERDVLAFFQELVDKQLMTVR